MKHNIDYIFVINGHSYPSHICFPQFDNITVIRRGNNGYSIDCMLPRYNNIDWTNQTHYTSNNNKHPSRKNSFYGYSINPYDVIFHKWYWHNHENVNFDIIKQYAEENVSIKLI